MITEQQVRDKIAELEKKKEKMMMLQRESPELEGDWQLESIKMDCIAQIKVLSELLRG